MKERGSRAPEEGRELDWIVGHRMRQRQRSQNGSWDDFRSHELLEVLLNYAVPRQDMSKLARDLVSRFGTALDALCVPAEALLAVEGMTPAMAEWLNLVGELVTLYQAAEGRQRRTIIRFTDVYEFLRPRLGWVRPPECWALYTNFEDVLISCQPLPQGRAWWDPENVRAMVEDCVALEARNVILVVFREDGLLRMDEAERKHLRSINSTFNTLQVALLDCVLANGRGAHSLSLHERFAFTRPEKYRSGLYSAAREDGSLREPPDSYGLP